MRWMKLMAVAILAVAAVGAGAPARAQGIVKLAVTTSFHNSGLSEVLLPEIRADLNLEVRLLIVGTGQALKLGRAGDVDAILVHSRAAEDAFVADGYGTHRREIMYNDFVLIGPRADPAAIGEAGDVDTAVIVLTHENGCLTTIDISRRAAYGYDQRVEAFGSNGMAQSNNHHDFNAVLATDQGYRQPPLQNFFLERYTASYLDQWAAFVDAVENGSPTPISGADGRAPLVIGMAAKRSMDEGRPVHISEIAGAETT